MSDHIFESLGKNIEKIFKNYQAKKTDELIKEAAMSKDMSTFFGQFHDSHILKRFLFLHRYDLFGDDRQMLYLYLCQFRSKDPDNTSLNRIISDEFYTYDYYLESIIENNIKNHKEDIGDITFYIGGQLIRKNQNIIKKIIETDNFDYYNMKEILKNGNIKWDYLEESLKDENIDPIIKGKIEELIVSIVLEIKGRVQKIAENVPKMIPNFILSFHLITKIWLDNLFLKIEIKEIEKGYSINSKEKDRRKKMFEDYLKFLNILYSSNILEHKNTLFWCENCLSEHLSYIQYQCIRGMSPSKMSKLKCPSCDKPYSYSSIFSLNDALKDIILSEDGILVVYLGWLLEKGGLEYKFGKYSTKYQNDFIIRKSILVECKMRTVKNDDRGIRSNIDDALDQIKKHIDQSNSDGNDIKYAYLVSNIYYREEYIRSYVDKYKELFEKYEFRIIYPDQIEKFVEEIKYKDL